LLIPLKTWQILNDHLKWSEHAAKGMIYNRESPFIIEGEYNLEWNQYTRYDSKNGEFRYLLVNIEGGY
jgi:hypothetical protein